MNIKADGGKIHTIRTTLPDGTNVMECGLSQQKPFTHSVTKHTCYGKWTVTTERASCKGCIRKSRPRGQKQ